MAEGRRKKIAQALERLAALYEWGALVAATDPAGLIEDVCDEIERLRARVAELEAALSVAADRENDALEDRATRVAERDEAREIAMRAEGDSAALREALSTLVAAVYRVCDWSEGSRVGDALDEAERVLAGGAT